MYLVPLLTTTLSLVTAQIYLAIMIYESVHVVDL